MSDYKTIRGTTVEVVASNPANLYDGQVWYNSTDSQLKIYKDVPLSWSTGGDLNTGKEAYGAAGNGTQTAGLIFGGEDNITTESYNGSSWTEVNDLNSPLRVGDSANGVQGAGTQTAALAISGYGGPFFGQTRLNTTESWNGSNWSEVSDLNSPRYLGSAAGTQTSTLVFAGRIPISDVPVVARAETETFNGSSWTEVSDLNTARSLLAGAGANNTSALAFGGNTPPGNIRNAITESWNGSSWTEVNDLNTARTSLGGNGTQTAALAFGGFFPGPSEERFFYANTESWNGTNWTEINDLNTSRGALDGIGTNTSALAAGGATPSTTTATEEFSGGAAVISIGSS